MDKNTVIGTLLIAALIIGFYVYTQPSEEQIAQQRRYLDSLEQVEIQQQQKLQQQLQQQENKITAEVEIIPNDSVIAQQNAMKFGRYAAAANGTEEFSTIESDLLSLTFSNKGGKLYSAELKEYKTYKQKEQGAEGNLSILGEGTQFGINLSEIGMSTNDLFFTKHQDSYVTKTDTSESIAYRLYASEHAYIEYVYTLKQGSYKIDFQINTVGMGQYIRESRYNLHWNTTTKLLERKKDGEDIYTNLVWKYDEDEIEETNPRTNDVETEDLSGRVKWVAFKQHFFSAILIAEDSFERGGEVVMTPIADNDTLLKDFSANLFLSKTESNQLAFYLGPNHYPTLKEQGVELEGILELGWFGVITKYAIIPVFNWLRSFIGNYGLIILLLTIIIKAVLFPLTFKSYMSTARMRVLRPQTDAINKKYDKKEDAMKRQQETMNLYKKAGVNPMGGCLPLLIQFPILIAMFRFFPASIELRQQSFLWAEDLSSFDAIVSWTTHIPLISSIYGNHISLFTLLMAASMIFVNKINSSNMVTQPGMPNMKVMMTLMSVMMVFWFNNYSSGLSFYYFLANLITIGQTLIIRQMIDDKAILVKLEENKKVPKKKSKFQQRLEDIQKQQQQQMKR